MPHSSDTADGREQLGLILDFAGVLTGSPRAVHRAWCVSEGLAPEAWRSTLNDHPEGRRLYAALEVGEIGQAEWNEGTAALLGAHVDPVNLMGRAWAGVPPARRMAALARAARAAGHRVALLSNSFGLDPFNPYEHVGIWGLFDVHVVSELVGLAKPDPLPARAGPHRLACRAVRVRRRSRGEPSAGRGAGHRHRPRHR